MNADVIVAWSPTAASVVKNATTTIPVVILAGPPLGQGLVKSVARPGENVTGITFIASDRLFSKYFEMPKELTSGPLVGVCAALVALSRSACRSSH